MLTAVIPSMNRAAVLHATIVSLANQSEPPSQILISVVDPQRDVLDRTIAMPGVRVVVGPKGSVQQRNTAIDSLRPECTLVSFFDDDVELHPEYLAHCRSFMREHPEAAGISGKAIADGTLTGEIPRAEAIEMLRRAPASSTAFGPRFALAGFDMTVRRSVVDRVRFDERMSLYALYEDTDFSVRAKEFGALITVERCMLVHLRTGSGRMSAVRLGYAQLINPLYLGRKGTLGWMPSIRQAVRSITGNALGCLIRRRGISKSERRDRLWGNALGLRDLLLRGPQPEGVQRIG